MLRDFLIHVDLIVENRGCNEAEQNEREESDVCSLLGHFPTCGSHLAGIDE